MTLSPLLGGACRFSPSCSTYAQQVLKDFPLEKAFMLICKRVFSCVPFGPYGFDPSPKDLDNSERRMRSFQ